MSMPIAALSSPSFKFPSFSRLSLPARSHGVSFRPKNQTFTPKFAHSKFGVFQLRKLGFCLNAAENEKGPSNDKVVDDLAGGGSTMPDRFRYLTKEAPDPPIIWPWVVALGFLLYAWRAVLFELGNWRKAAFATVSFAGYLFKLLLAVIFHFFGDPITSAIRCIETLLFTVQSYYSWIIACAPIPKLTTIIALSSIVLAIGEAAVPNAVTSQPYILTISGLIGYAAVRNYLTERGFWTLLVGIYGFSRFVKKRDDVTSALPAAAVLAAVGEPWVRIVVVSGYLSLAVMHRWKKLSQGKEDVEVAVTGQRVPVPLLCVALAIGIRLAANWAGYRHLTWMIA